MMKEKYSGMFDQQDEAGTKCPQVRSTEDRMSLFIQNHTNTYFGVALATGRTHVGV
jgi:hypothetical protein